MALRQIVEVGDPILEKKCRPVSEINDHILEILDDMTETMRDAEGVGLAGPQVGILRRIVCIELDGKLYELINPVIKKASGEQYELEGCLSVPGLSGRVRRPAKVSVEALDRGGNKISFEGEGLLARAVCHELDHLEGILYTEKAEEIYTNEELAAMEKKQ